MEASNPLGTTVTVGSVSELATILANMPPEQLENVQLDPILYNALFQTLDSNPQILDGNDQVVDQPSVQPIKPDVQLKDLAPQVNLQPMVQDPIPLLQPTDPISNNSGPSSQKIVDIAKNPSKIDAAQKSNLRETIPTPFASNKTVVPSKSTTPHTRTVSQPTANTKNLQAPQQVVKRILKNDVNTLNKPMSVVRSTSNSYNQPLLSTQPIKSNKNVSSAQNTQVVTLPSNAYLQPSIVQSINGEKSLNQVVPVDFQVQQQSKETPGLVDEKVIVSHTVASSFVPSQISDMEAAAFLKENPGSVSTTSNLDVFSIPINTNNVQTLENDICVDNTSAIVLTAEQLTEIMSGKTLEEVLQGTISEQGLESVLVTDSSISSSLTQVPNMNVPVATDVMPPLRPTPTRVIGQNGSPLVSVKLPEKNKQVPTNRPQVCERNKIQTVKPTAQLAGVKNNFISASLPTPFSSVCPANKNQKNAVISNSNKPSAFTPYKQTPNILKTVDKKVTPKQNNTNNAPKIDTETLTDKSKVDPVNKSIFKSPSKKIFSAEKPNQPQEVHKQTKVFSQPNIVKSGNIDNNEKKIQKSNTTTLNTDKDKIEPVKPSKATFSRSFKKTSPSGDSKKNFKKTLREVGKTYPNEVNEILSIREAIKSSHVGDGENAMRQLAKLEIENQLKRFSQKVNSRKPEKSPEKRIDYRRRRKNSDNDRPKRNKQNEDDSESNKKADTSIVSKDGGRKRERPKKFDDFVLGSKPKKDKKLKTRKFFFPGDTTSDKSVATNIEQDETLSKEKNISVDENNEKNIVQKPITKKTSEKVNSENLIGEKTIIEKPISNALTKLYSPKKTEKYNLQEKKSTSVKSTKKDEKIKTVEDLLRSKILEYDNQLEKAKKQGGETSLNKNAPEQVEKTDDLTAENAKPLESPSDKPKSGNERSFLDVISTNKTAAIDPKKEEDTEKDTDENDKDMEQDESEEDEKENIVDKKPTKEGTKTTNKTVKKKKKKKKPAITFEPEVLPEHLKKKPKVAVEDVVVDLSKVQLKSSCIETSFELNDSVELKTCELLKRNGWVCTFCGKPGNIGNLDVLFGPYSVKISDCKNDNDTNMKVWMHRDCAIWTSSICLSNQTLCGLGDALTTAANMACSLCTKVGATLQCSSRQCRDNYHFVCAKQRGCSFKIDNFTIICPKHK